MDKDFIAEARMDDQTAIINVAPAELPHPPLGDLRQLRISKRESQEKFWGRFGVTQSSGSRFETGLSIPAPVAILLKLYVNGKLNDGDLQG
ncbi:MAG: helix-turn-helix domain-containing protein [Telluria sp.]